ncbi:MAG: hypothetical protein IPN94_18260 [Sphingobacteriales bacterium]|nr:hypothetical protein [Sphingobacteriales bacterium]
MAAASNDFHVYVVMLRCGDVQITIVSYQTTISPFHSFTISLFHHFTLSPFRSFTTSPHPHIATF